MADLAFGVLTKILKENTINKLTVCETLVRLGNNELYLLFIKCHILYFFNLRYIWRINFD